MPADPSCVFCTLPHERIVLRNAAGVAIRDAFPVSRGHTLVVPRRHVASFFKLERDERDDLLELLACVREGLERELHAAGYNVGINDGAAAGQTVMHLHIHLMPRFEGDMADPRGGVRWVFPDKVRIGRR
jgi:diadenosine tetraphosphate (Ap4A) HIT family hydrolase